MTFESIVHGIPDDMFAAFEPVLPPVTWKGNGRPPYSNRACLQAAVFILTSGTPWRQMPAGFPCGRTVRDRLKQWLASDSFLKVWAGCVGNYQRQRGINFDQISIDGARKPAKKGDLRRVPTDRGKCGTQVVIVATADDLPIGATLCGANRQDASFTAQALRSVVATLPVDPMLLARPMAPPPCPSKKLSGAQRRKVRAKLVQAASGCDFRAMPFLRGDGNFAKDPARIAANDAGYRLWAPSVGQSRRGLGRIRSSVERAHAFLNQFGRIARRLDRNANRYLAWVQLAACIIFMRRGFFP